MGVDQNEDVDLGVLPLKSYSEKLCILRDKLKIQQNLQKEIRSLENEISSKAKEYNKVYEIVLNKRRREGQVDALHKKITEEEGKLAERTELLCAIKENLKKKKEDKEFFSKVFNAFEEDLLKNQQTLLQHKERLDMYQKIYIARKLKVLFILGYVFFNDKSGSIFKTLLRLKDIHTTTEKVDHKIANSLGVVVMLGILMSKYLNLSLAYPMIYNGPRSFIKFGKTEDIPLFLASKSDRARFLKGIELLVQNFLQIIAFCGITFKSRYESDPTVQLPEILICLTNYLSHFFIQQISIQVTSIIFIIVKRFYHKLLRHASAQHHNNACSKCPLTGQFLGLYTAYFHLPKWLQFCRAHKTLFRSDLPLLLIFLHSMYSDHPTFFYYYRFKSLQRL
eukprot:TRINITY_DN2281_c1_g1_i1.p2 TRINITY_DN2281_c1_g1~~TRINITY_DN2281_c1_g1_i1.p2  ORF type:complete len:393 (-),score=29.66 TRINITY_DN2281_c1_g1_i1:2474-3652(-)